MAEPSHPSISVAMCTYNGSRYIEAQLESIGRQQHAVRELVVCDDGSSDGTVAIVEAFSRRAPFPVTIVRNERNLGSSKNFEKAIRLCRGDLVALADQDDIWFSNKTAVLVAELSRNESAGGIFTDAALIDESAEETGTTLWEQYGFTQRDRDRASAGDFASVLLQRPVVTGATFMFRRNLLAEVLPIPDGWVHDEWISWRIALCSSLIFSSVPVMAYRVHASQQIGVPPGLMARCYNAWKAVRHGPSPATKSRVRSEYLHGALALGRLTEGVSRPAARFEYFRDGIRAKIEFCESVLRSYQRHRLQRVGFALRNFSNYRRFRYHPMYSLVRDLLL